MRPADHPDFFRLPPPDGRSRESSIVLDAEGRFHHDGALVEHPGMAKAFASWIQRHPDDGRYILNNGYDWSYFSVADAPFFVLSVREIAGVLWLSLSDGSETPLHPAALRVGARDALYTSVKDGAFMARFTAQAQAALSPWLAETEDGQILLQIAGARHSLGNFGEGS